MYSVYIFGASPALNMTFWGRKSQCAFLMLPEWKFMTSLLNFVHSYPQVMPWPLHHSHSSPIQHHHHTRATLHPPTLSWWHQHQHQHQHRSQITTKRRSLSNSNRLSQQLSLRAGIVTVLCVCVCEGGRDGGGGGGRGRRRLEREKCILYWTHRSPNGKHNSCIL